jgi:uncharacterized protein (TIGR02246 family)
LIIPFLSLRLIGQTSPATASPASSIDVAEIAGIREQWVRHWNAGELQPILQSYAPDAVLLPPTGQRVIGREAIGKYFQQARDSGLGPLTLQSIECYVAGSLAYNSGRLQYTTGESAPRTHNQVSPMTPTLGVGRTVEGNYLVVLRREKDGRWLIVQHAFTEAVMARGVGTSVAGQGHPGRQPRAESLFFF